MARPWQQGTASPSALLEFPPWQGVADGRFAYDFLGVKTDPRVVEHLDAAPAGHLTTAYPEPNSSDYFEYAVVLDSVLATADADRPFTFIELGAGWGAWMAIVHRAAGSGRSVRSSVSDGAQQSGGCSHTFATTASTLRTTRCAGAVSDYDGRGVHAATATRPGIRPSVMKASGSP